MLRSIKTALQTTCSKNRLSDLDARSILDSELSRRSSYWSPADTKLSADQLWRLSSTVGLGQDYCRRS